jgi:hypothetical protein
VWILAAIKFMSDTSKKTNPDWKEAAEVAIIQREQWKHCAVTCARVLSMHDQSQISISIPEWEEMKQKAIAYFKQL